MRVPGMSITIDCRNPGALVDFWCAAIGYVPEPPPRGHASWLAYWQEMGIPDHELAGVDAATCDSIVDPGGRRPRIWFQKVPEPRTSKNRMHLDLDVTGGRSADLAARRLLVDAEVQRLVAQGAQRLRDLEHTGADYYAVVMADPEGNEFCLS